MSEPYWEPLAGTMGPQGPTGPIGPTGPQGPGGAGSTLPDRLGDACSWVPGSPADWNNALSNGWYMHSSANNSPVAGNWFYGIVTQHNTDWVQQRVWLFTGAGNEYIREKVAGNWTAWRLAPSTMAGGEFYSGVLANDTHYAWVVTYPVAFRGTPKVLLTMRATTAAANNFWLIADEVSNSQFTLHIYNVPNSNQCYVTWLAFL